jgi:hypothetical protein
VSRLWPVAEAAQGDYETLRAAALGGTVLLDGAGRRFQRHGLFGLICRPSAQAIFTAELFGARRQPWTPYSDARLDALGDAFELITTAGQGFRQQRQETGT